MDHQQNTPLPTIFESQEVRPADMDSQGTIKLEGVLQAEVNSQATTEPEDVPGDRDSQVTTDPEDITETGEGNNEDLDSGAIRCNEKEAKEDCVNCQMRWYPEVTKFKASTDVVANYKKKKSGCLLNHIDWKFVPQFHREVLFYNMGITPCHCERCRDKTEGGTYFQAFRCDHCVGPTIGFVAPIEPLGKKQEWTCLQCGHALFDADHVKTYYFKLDKQLSDGDDDPIEKMACLTDYQERGPLHSQHFLFFKGVAQVLTKVLEMNLIQEIFFDTIVDIEIDKFRGQLMSGGRYFASLLRKMGGNEHYNYFTVQERFANAMVLLTFVYGIEARAVKADQMDLIIRNIYFRDELNPLIYKSPAACKKKYWPELRRFEKSVINLVNNSLKATPGSGIDKGPYVYLKRLILANSIVQ